MNKFFLLLVLIISSLGVGAQDVINMTTPVGAEKAFTKFIKKEKFGQDSKLKYEGIRNPLLRASVTKKVNEIATDFLQVSKQEVPTDYAYQKKIMFGLANFKEIKDELTKEDRARVSHYIIELMDIIDLKSSKGQLNMFVYGFDPSTLKIDEKKK